MNSISIASRRSLPHLLNRAPASCLGPVFAFAPNNIAVQAHTTKHVEPLRQTRSRSPDCHCYDYFAPPLDCRPTTRCLPPNSPVPLTSFYTTLASPHPPAPAQTLIPRRALRDDVCTPPPPAVSWSRPYHYHCHSSSNCFSESWTLQLGTRGSCLTCLSPSLPTKPLGKRHLYTMASSRRDSLHKAGTPMREGIPHSVELVTDQLETPSLDDRTYRVIRLPNQLEALLVHDPQTDKASASMDVNVGSFSDEDDMPGMAHAVEHVSFHSHLYCGSGMLTSRGN